MISRRTLQHWTYPIRVGFWLKSIPFRWNWNKKDGGHLELVYSRRWHCLVCLNIAFRCVLVVCIIFVTLRSHFDAVTNVLSLFFISIYTFSIIMQSVMLRHYRNIHGFMNKMMRLNQQLRKQRLHFLFVGFSSTCNVLLARIDLIFQ